MDRRFFSPYISAMLALATSVAAITCGVQAQESSQHDNSDPTIAVRESLKDLQAQIAELKSMVVDMGEEVAQSRAETRELRHQLEATRTPLPSAAAPATANIAPDSQSPEEPALDQRLAKLEEDQQLLGEKVNDQYQTKVESGSKYRVRLSGIVLLNLFNNIGTVENQDFPRLATDLGPLDSGLSFGGSLRQSQLGLEAFGPEIAGARTSADIQFDFAGGFPAAPNGTTFGLVRLRTGTVHFDWEHTSIIAGQDALFISPLAPSSLDSLALPAFAYSGELWSWTPQLHIEHRVSLSDGSGLLFQGGILDSLSGQQPSSAYIYQRTPDAGEQSGQPAYAVRIAWTHRLLGRSLTIGGGGYYGHQNWGVGRNVNSWAGTSDWTLPLGSRFDLSGEFYRGRAIGSLGGGIGRSVLFSGAITDPATIVHGLDSIGGWAQLKFRATNKLEFNGTFGQDNPWASEVRQFSTGQENYFDPSLTRNQSSLVNFIYKPRSDILLSLEYLRIRTSSIRSGADTANQVNMSVGVLF